PSHSLSSPSPLSLLLIIILFSIYPPPQRLYDAPQKTDQAKRALCILATQLPYTHTHTHTQTHTHAHSRTHTHTISCKCKPITRHIHMYSRPTTTTENRYILQRVIGEIKEGCLKCAFKGFHRFSHS